MEIPILYHDVDYLIVNKPANIRIDGPTNTPTLESILYPLYPQYSKLYLCHQLDCVTSGVFAFATSSKACSKTGKLFMQRKVVKHYTAIVKGHILPTKKIVIDKKIAKAENKARSMCISDDGKESVTIVNVMKHGIFTSLRGDIQVTLVDLTPQTGRTHQLRVHLASIGHPILGDSRYDPDLDHNDNYFSRVYLHSYSIMFPFENGDLKVSTENPFISLIT